MQTQTILKTQESKTGTGKTGKPWTLRVFQAANGNSYQTFEASIANKAYELLGEPATIEFEEQERNGYVNYVLLGVEPAAGAVESRTQPENRVSPDVVHEDDRQIRIMRQSALDRAISATAAGIAEASSEDDLYRIADRFIDYFVNGVAAKPELAVVAGGANNSSDDYELGY